MNAKRIFADFNNADAVGRVRLNTAGTLADLEDCNIELKEGLEIEISDGELVARTTVTWSSEERVWVAVIRDYR